MTISRGEDIAETNVFITQANRGGMVVLGLVVLTAIIYDSATWR